MVLPCLGLLLGTEAPVMTPNGIDVSFRVGEARSGHWMLCSHDTTKMPTCVVSTLLLTCLAFSLYSDCHGNIVRSLFKLQFSIWLGLLQSQGCCLAPYAN